MIVEIVGTLGACLLLFSYFLASTGRISSESTTGPLLNLGGAIMLGVNAFVHGAIPPATLNVLWALIALVALIKQLKAARPPTDRSDI
jgi:hypothetical protein